MNNSAPLLWNCGGQQERGSWVANADFCYSQVKAILLWKLGVANQNLPQGALSVRHTTPSALTPFIQMRTTSPEESSFNKEKKPRAESQRKKDWRRYRYRSRSRRTIKQLQMLPAEVDLRWFPSSTRKVNRPLKHRTDGALFTQRGKTDKERQSYTN